MNITQSQEICSLCYLMKTANKHVIIPSPNTMRDILDKVYGHKISRRTHFQAIHELIKDGLLVRKFRYDQKITERIIQKSSMVSFTLKGVKYLMKMGVAYAYTLYTKMIAWLHKDDKRFPTPDTSGAKRTDDVIDYENNLLQVRKLLLQLEHKTK